MILCISAFFYGGAVTAGMECWWLELASGPHGGCCSELMGAVVSLLAVSPSRDRGGQGSQQGVLSGANKLEGEFQNGTHQPQHLQGSLRSQK